NKLGNKLSRREEKGRGKKIQRNSGGMEDKGKEMGKIFLEFLIRLETFFLEFLSHGAPHFLNSSRKN
ncbi:MAG: hypothetical protein ACP5U1_02935, partial [Desulfomonilaceae bacterium]